MSTGYQIKEQDELYCVTFQIVRWIDIFIRKKYANHKFAFNTTLQDAMPNMGVRNY